MNFLDGKDVGFIGRQKNSIVLKYDKTIIITTDILEWNDHEGDGKKIEPSISLSDISEKIEMFAKDILIEGKDSQREAESTVYGESLVELLRWMIRILKEHSHPPNGIAIPDFHQVANTRYSNMETDLLNKQVKTR